MHRVGSAAHYSCRSSPRSRATLRTPMCLSAITEQNCHAPLLPTPASTKIPSLPLCPNQAIASPSFSSSTQSPLAFLSRDTSALSFVLFPPRSLASSGLSGIGSMAIRTRNASQFQLFTSRSHSVKSSLLPVAYSIPGWPILENPTRLSEDERWRRSLRLVGEMR